MMTHGLRLLLKFQVVSLPVRVIGPTPMATIELSNSNGKSVQQLLRSQFNFI